MTLAELASISGAALLDAGDRSIRGVATLQAAGPGDVAAFHHPRYREPFLATKAGAVVVRPQAVAEAKAAGLTAALLVSDDPYLAFARIVRHLHPPRTAQAGIDPRAAVDASAAVDPSAQVGPFAFVGPGAKVGARTILAPFSHVGGAAEVGSDCILYSGAVLARGCVLGDRVILQPNAVVGSDGFGYAFDAQAKAHLKVPQIGRVRVEDDVEIGACACVDRAALGETVIGRGTKIDNLVQIAHNVQVGPLSILCAQAGIAGSSDLGAGVVLAGQVGVAGHLRLGDGVKVAARGGVMNDLAADETYSGAPAIPRGRWLRQASAERHLPELVKELRRLEERVRALEASSTAAPPAP